MYPNGVYGLEFTVYRSKIHHSDSVHFKWTNRISRIVRNWWKTDPNNYRLYHSSNGAYAEWFGYASGRPQLIQTFLKRKTMQIQQNRWPGKQKWFVIWWYESIWHPKIYPDVFLGINCVCETYLLRWGNRFHCSTGPKRVVMILSISNGQPESRKSRKITKYKHGSLPMISQNQIRRHTKWFGHARGRPRLFGPENNENLSKNRDIYSKDHRFVQGIWLQLQKKFKNEK